MALILSHPTYMAKTGKKVSEPSGEAKAKISPAPGSKAEKGTKQKERPERVTYLWQRKVRLERIRLRPQQRRI